MDKCEITLNQINTLLSGESVIVEHEVNIGMGHVRMGELELVPEKFEFRCSNCDKAVSWFIRTVNKDGSITSCCNYCQ